MKGILSYISYMLFAVVSLLLIACEPETIDDTPTNGTQRPISFNNGPARAHQVPASDANARIWAYYTSGTNTNWVWNGENAKLDIGTTANTDGNFDGTFTVNGNTKYWDNGTYNFYSIYSEDFKTSTDATFTDNKLTFTYSIANQNELRLATATVSATKTHGEAVPFQFNHLLSRIKFRGSSSVDGMPIKMTKFTVSARRTATYTIESTPNCTTTDTTTCLLPYVDGVNTVTNATGFMYKDDSEVLKDEGGNTIKSLKYTELPYAATLEAGKILKQIENSIETTEDYGWLVFPTTTAGEISIIVEYVDNQGIITQKTAPLPSTTTLEMGNSYIFQFSIQPSGTIVFANEVIINDWGETDAEIDIQF